MIATLVVIYITICILCFLVWRKIKSKKNVPEVDIDEVLKCESKQAVRRKERFVMILFLFLVFAFPIAFTILWSALVKAFIFTDINAVYFSSGFGIPLIALFLICIPLVGLIIVALPLSKYSMSYSKRAGSPYISKKKGIEIFLLMFLILFGIGFPFVILNTSNYTYIKNDEISHNSFFSFTETNYQIPDDIEYTNIRYSQDRDGDYTFYYDIYLSDDSKIEVLHNNLKQSKKVVFVNDIMLDNQIDIRKDDISLEQWIAIEKQCPDQLVSSLKHMYRKFE